MGTRVLGFTTVAVQHAAPQRRASFWTLLLLFLSLPSFLFSGTTGSLEGTVTDRANGEAIIGASIRLENTLLGDASDVNGFYNVQNIPAGGNTPSAARSSVIRRR